MQTSREWKGKPHMCSRLQSSYRYVDLYLRPLVNFEYKEWNTKLSSPWERRNLKWRWHFWRLVMGDFNIMIFSNSNFLFWNCNFKSTESEFELRLISKSLVNGKIGVFELTNNEFEIQWILRWILNFEMSNFDALLWISALTVCYFEMKTNSKSNKVAISE